MEPVKIFTLPLKNIPYVCKDIPHPNENGKIKRQTTFKPISHVLYWNINIYDKDGNPMILKLQ